jgi:hypothetical protein
MTRLTSRSLTTEALTEIANVRTRSFSSDAGGGGSVTISSGSDQPCRIDPLGGDEGEVAGRISDRSTHLVTLPADTPIAGANELSIDGRGTFEVTAVRESTDEFARFIEVVARS